MQTTNEYNMPANVNAFHFSASEMKQRQQLSGRIRIGQGWGMWIGIKALATRNTQKSRKATATSESFE
jgi:hypothetical protein